MLLRRNLTAITILWTRNCVSISTRDHGRWLEGYKLTSSIEEGIWNRVWALTDDGRPLELAKLDVAIVPRVPPPSPQN